MFVRYYSTLDTYCPILNIILYQKSWLWFFINSERPMIHCNRISPSIVRGLFTFPKRTHFSYSDGQRPLATPLVCQEDLAVVVQSVGVCWALPSVNETGWGGHRGIIKKGIMQLNWKYCTIIAMVKNRETLLLSIKAIEFLYPPAILFQRHRQLDERFKMYPILAGKNVEIALCAAHCHLGKGDSNADNFTICKVPMN